MSPCWSSRASGHNIRLLLIRGGRKREFGESIKKALQGVLWWWRGSTGTRREDDDGWIIKEKRYQD
jgi:hypothetical protein